ncbi:hypothetical protein [Corynebacterium kroppenstedtii]
MPGPAAEVTGRHPLDNGVVPVRTEGGDAQLSHGFALVGIKGVRALAHLSSSWLLAWDCSWSDWIFVQ